MPVERADEIGAAFFRNAGQTAFDNGTTICIEPNPPEYGCDWVTTTEDAERLVQRVDHPGFGLHLDAGTLTLHPEPAKRQIPRLAVPPRHFHVSEPHLVPVGSLGTDHSAYARQLHTLGYSGWCSIEMKPAGASGNVEHVARALRVTINAYGSPRAVSGHPLP